MTASGPIGRATPLAAVEHHYQIALLGLVTSGYLAIVTGGLLDAPATVLTGLALLVRALMIPGILKWRLPDHFEARAGLCYLAFYPIDWYFLSQDSIAATVHLLLFLGVLRLFAAKTPRDYRFVQTLALLQMLAATLSASVYFLFFLATFLMFGIATLAGAEVLRSATKQPVIVQGRLHSFGWRLTGLTFFIAFTIVVIAAGMFFVLPRSAHAAFQHLSPFRNQFPGLSNVVSLGAIGEIQQSDSPLVHVRMSGQLKPANLKWRGMVLSQFDGHQWSQGKRESPVIPVENGVVRLGDRPLRSLGFQYEVRMQDLDSDVLFLAGRPQMAQLMGINNVYGSRDTGYRVPGRPPGPFAYTGYSILDEPGTTFGALSDEDRAEYLHLPPTDPRVGELAKTWIAGGFGPLFETEAIERHLRKDFSYTLELPAKKARDPLAYFLFERRKGHCEYFASAMAVMLRTRGIPSRVVTGFQSGVMNPVNGWLILRASDAHSWVEAWIDGRGWMTFDPTPSGVAVAKPQWLQQTRFYMDAFEVFWSEWVVGYDFDRQLRLAVEMHDSSRSTSVGWLDRLAAGATWLNTDFPKYAKRWWLPAISSVGSALILVFGIRWIWNLLSGRGRLVRLRGGGGQRSDATLLYQRMLKALNRRGIDKHAWITAGEFARSVTDSELRKPVNEITALYDRLRFGGDAAAAARMFDLVTRFERLP